MPNPKNMFNLHFKQFKNIENLEEDSITDCTVFEYFQYGNKIWGNYEGGKISQGTLRGFKTSENSFELEYSHINSKGELKTGKYDTEVAFTKEGKLILSEFWKWNKKKSTLIEV